MGTLGLMGSSALLPPSEQMPCPATSLRGEAAHVLAKQSANFARLPACADHPKDFVADSFNLKSTHG
jgi:hypothetical protein